MYQEERTYSEFFQNAKPAPGPRKVLGSGVRLTAQTGVLLTGFAFGQWSRRWR